MAINDPNTDVDLMAVRLIPGADYRLAGIGQPGYDNLAASWVDAQPLPTEAEVNAEQVIFLTEIPADAILKKRSDKDIFLRFLFRVLFDQENRLRTLEGNPTITRAVYLIALRNEFRITP